MTGDAPPTQKNAPSADRKRASAAIKIWLPVILYISVIMLMALRPVPALLRAKHVDKVVHVALYGVLACLAFRSFRRSGTRHPAFLAFFLAVSVGMAEEGLQGLGNRRTADRYDLLADAAGALAAVVAVKAIRRSSRAAAPPDSDAGRQ